MKPQIYDLQDKGQHSRNEQAGTLLHMVHGAPKERVGGTLDRGEEAPARRECNLTHHPNEPTAHKGSQRLGFHTGFRQGRLSYWQGKNV